jgi:hypothetical protein
MTLGSARLVRYLTIIIKVGPVSQNLLLQVFFSKIRGDIRNLSPLIGVNDSCYKLVENIFQTFEKIQY